jgi:hypothetical protein
LLHEKLLELAEMGEGRGEVVGSAHVFKEFLIDFGVVFLFDPFDLLLHLLIKIIEIYSQG